MTQPDSWERIFERVGKVPGSTKQQPAKKTVQALQDEAQFQRRQYAWDVAVSMGQVQTEGDDDPYTAINDAWNAGGQSTADLEREQQSIAAGLAQLQADVKANNNSGKSFIVPVTDYGTSVPSVFDLIENSGAGAIYNDGNTLQMSNNDGRELLGYNVEPLATDHFEVSLLVPKQPGTALIVENRTLYWVGRRDATSDNFCIARLRGTKLRVGAVIDGVSTVSSPTWFGSGADGSGPTEVTITPSIYMNFSGGTGSDTRIFQFKVNNQVRATFKDSGAVSALGEDYRWTAFGIENSADAITNQSPSISHFMANDNAPADIVGSYARMARLNTSNISVFSDAHELTGFFDITMASSPDITPNPANGSFTVNKSKPYIINTTLRCGGSWPNHFQFVLYLNGILDHRFGADFGYTSNALGGTQLPDGIAGSTSINLNEGDTVQLGYWSDGGTPNALRGDATGGLSWVTITGAG